MAAETILFMHDDSYGVQTVVGAEDVAGGFQGYRPYWQADGWPDNCGVDRRFWTAWARGPDGPVIWPAVVDDFGTLRSSAAVCQLAQERRRAHGVPATGLREGPSQREAMELALAALHTAVAGLEWYRDRCPDAVDGSDGEADDEIGAAIAALDGALGAGVPGTAPDLAALLREAAERLQEVGQWDHRGDSVEDAFTEQGGEPYGALIDRLRAATPGVAIPQTPKENDLG